MGELYKRQRQCYVHAVFFALFLTTFIILTITMAAFSTGPIVLGTEMNANGLVEYLCLGNGCENLYPMDW